MKAVAADALRVVDQRGIGSRLATSGRSCVKRGVEAGDLGNVGSRLPQGLDERDLGRKMIRREGDDAFESIEKTLRDSLRRVVVRASVHDPVSDCRQLRVGDRFAT